MGALEDLSVGEILDILQEFFGDSSLKDVVILDDLLDLLGASHGIDRHCLPSLVDKESPSF